MAYCSAGQHQRVSLPGQDMSRGVIPADAGLGVRSRAARPTGAADGRTKRPARIRQ